VFSLSAVKEVIFPVPLQHRDGKYITRVGQPVIAVRQLVAIRATLYAKPVWIDAVLHEHVDRDSQLTLATLTLSNDADRKQFSVIASYLITIDNPRQPADTDEAILLEVERVYLRKEKPAPEVSLIKRKPRDRK
jgi:hypothetical protein